MSTAADVPPAIPTEYQIYNSYEIDPTWQRKFSIIWASVAGAAILFSLPHLIRSIRRGYTLENLTGVWEDSSGRSYEPLLSDKFHENKKEIPGNQKRMLGWNRLKGLLSVLHSFTMWTAPHIGLDVGQIFLVVAYFVVLILCITLHSELIDNPNRAGFMAIAQLPVVFLLSTKNSLLSLALGAGRGWEKLNYLHRWAGRGLTMSATIHGALWIRNHLQYELAILGQQKETSGVACLGLLGVIVLSSLKPIRVWCYQVFLLIHTLGYVAFFITLCYHTIYAVPYIFPPLAFYGLDLLLRMFRFRVKDATLTACDKQMTIVRVHDCDGGWHAGQHVHLRVFIGARIFESHPLTILSAPQHTSCLSDNALVLGARVKGDWSRAINEYARTNEISLESYSDASDMVIGNQAYSDNDTISEVKRLSVSDEDDPDSKGGIVENVHEFQKYASMAGVQVQVTLDGPYGGSSVDIGEYARVLLVAGGSGVTFTLGLLDDIVGRCSRLGRPAGERTHKIEFVWCVRSFGCIRWFARQFAEIQNAASKCDNLDVHISVFVTCACELESLPVIQNFDVLVERPIMSRLLSNLVDVREGGLERGVSMESWSGLAVCSAGPEQMTREAKNALAQFVLKSGKDLGKVGCHTEVYAL